MGGVFECTLVRRKLTLSICQGVQRRLSDLCVDVWNLTQRWEQRNGIGAQLLEKIINARLRLLYARQSSSFHPAGQQLNAAVSFAGEDQMKLIGDTRVQSEFPGTYNLNQDQRSQILKCLIEDTEHLVKIVEEEMSRIRGKFQRAIAQLNALRKLFDQSTSAVMDRSLKKRLTNAEIVIPELAAAYQRELSAKRAALSDLANYDCRTVFVAIIASWNQQPFIDGALLTALYALEIIELEFDRLPDDVNEVIAILRGEHAALHLWVDLALAYYRRGNEADFVRILELSGSEANLDYPEYPRDQMRALDTLAAYYVMQSHKERNKEKKKEWQTKATLLYTTADKIIMYDTNHLLGRAYFCLLEGKTDQAEQQFNFVLNQVGENIPAMLGKACIFFQKKEYRKSLNCYKSVLRKKPDCPADVRLGIGYCLSKLGKVEKARLAFERVLELEPQNVYALIALAILDMNNLDAEGIQNGVQSLGRAYQIDQENPVVLNHLANHFFYRNDMDRVEHLAWHAFQITENEAMRAESCYQLARSFHQRGNFEKAFQHYYQATQFATPNFVLPYFGLGQMYIHREDLDNAIVCFEKVLKLYPSNYDTLKVLGSLYAHSEPAEPKEKAERRRKAKELLKKAVEMCPDDVEALIEFAQLTESSDPQASLEAYTKAADFLQNTLEVDVPPEITNNIGSLAFSMGQYEKAKESFEAASQKLSEDIAAGQNDLAALQTTVTYNLARCLEMLCLFDDAERLYKGILHEKQNYIDCYMRLGCLARDKGQIYESSVWFKEAMSVSQTHADAWTLIGNLHMSKCEWAPAQKKFEYILKLNEYHNDPYSLVALGNVWLETLSSVHRRREKDKDYRERALMMYSKALKVHPKNIWAANGIGCILAQKGAVQEARDIFAQVREATADFWDVWVNIAHIYMEQKQYVSAIQMYDNCMRKFRRYNDVSLMQYMARAYYKAGKLDECRHMLEKAMCEAPDNLMVKFNYAFVLQKLATETLRDEKSSLHMVNGAVDDLKTAESMFTYISQNRDETMGQARLVSRTASATEARSCSDLLKQAQTYVQRAKAQDEEEQRQRQRQEEERLALKRQQEAEAKEREEKTRRELEALKQMRQEYVEKTKEFLRLPTVVEEKRSRGGGGGRRRRDREGDEFVNDSSDMGEWGNDEGGESRKKKSGEKKRGRKRRERRERSEPESGGEEGEEVSHRRREKKRKKKGEEKREMELSTKQKAKVKSREFVASSEDESSDDGANKPSTAAHRSSGSEGGEESPEPAHITGSDSSGENDERPAERSSSEPESDAEQDVSRSRSHKTSENSDSFAAESGEDRALPSSDSDEGNQASSPVKTKKKRIVLSDEDRSDAGSPLPKSDSD
ncbi:unnamed protein product [Toxocara canis]|uniref:RNA polymerase-associated protein CTR9-like protein n=1 Tax=Toxocara canis TaxID=6265 RepID=A0A183UHU0_TOXCA|nr:unnamed protein product [Toxocara canis]